MKKARVPDSKETQEGCSEGSQAILNSVEKLIVEMKADRLVLTEVIRELLIELRKVR